MFWQKKITKRDLWGKIYGKFRQNYADWCLKAPSPSIFMVEADVKKAIASGKYKIIPEENNRKLDVKHKKSHQIGEGKDALTLSVSTGKTTYITWSPKDKNYEEMGDIYRIDRPTDFIKLDLSSNGVSLYSIEQRKNEDLEFPDTEDANKVCDMKRTIAERLYDDKTPKGQTIKKLLFQIKEDQLIDEIRQLLETTPQRRIEEKQKKARQKQSTEVQHNKDERVALINIKTSSKRIKKDPVVPSKKELKEFPSGGSLVVRFADRLNNWKMNFFGRDGRK